MADTMFTIRINDEVSVKLQIIKEITEGEYRESGLDINLAKSDIIKEAIDKLYFEKTNKNNQSVLYQTIVSAITQYLNSQVRVDNYFKNNMLTEVIINQVLLKKLLEKNGLKYDDLIHDIQFEIENRITTYGEYDE